MNKLLLGLALVVGIAAAVVWKMQSGDPGSSNQGSSNQGGNASAVGGGQQPQGRGDSVGASDQGVGAAKQDPVALKVEDLLPTFLSERHKSEALIVVPGELTKGMVEPLEAAKVRFRMIKELSHNRSYYVNQIIPRLRKERAQCVWVIFDRRDPEVLDSFNEFLISKHRIGYQRDFGHLSLLKIINELVDADPGSNLIHLEPVISKRGATITDLLFTADGERLLYSEKRGTLRCRQMSSGATSKVLDLPKSKEGVAGIYYGGESGLIGIALHPKFATKRKLYTHYNYQDAEAVRRARVSEWDLDAKFVASNERVLMEVSQPRSDHNGGQLLFGPNDGYLYIGVGDGGEGKHTIGRAPAQTYRGKVFRIDVETTTGDKAYGIPADNPFLGHDVLPPETFAWGFRNPWRMSFTPDGRIVAGDIGENIKEELTFVVAGRHHGWPYYEGDYSRNKWTLKDQVQQPTLLAYGRTVGMSVIGGRAYRGTEIEALRGRYVFCDFISGIVWGIELPESTDTSLTIDDAQELGRWPQLFTTFGEDPQGNLYVATNTGLLYRIEEARAGQTSAPIAIEAMEDEAARGMFEAVMEGPKRPKSTPAQVALGKQLYSDQRLSSTGKVSCAACHALDNYGQDGKQFSLAANGKKTARNTPPTFNARHQYAQYWDYRTETVEQVAAEKLLTLHGLQDDAKVREALLAVPAYADAFAKAFPGDSQAVSAQNAAVAIGAFVRQLETTSRWDAYLDGDNKALTAREKVGLSTFVAVGCISCHQFRGLGGSMPHKLGLMKPWRGKDRGHSLISKEASQDYYFKVPQLSNIAKTGPYLHDGSVKTLTEVVRLMCDLQVARKVSKKEVGDMVAFLKSLTGGQPAVLK